VLLGRQQLRRLDRLARAEHRSRSAMLRVLVDRAVGQRPAPEAERAAG
jgi:predicted transcriptional regulator